MIWGNDKRYAMVVDTRLCVGCKACVLACNAENKVPHGFSRDWIVEEVRGEFPKLSMEIRSERCNHCENPPCVDACPTGASHVNEGGTVLVSHNKCTGCKACIAACPYDARFVHPDGYVDKCTFCLHRVEEGKDPACVEVCPTFCMTFGDLNDPDSEVSRLLKTRKYKVNHPETGCEPNVYFLI
jgi:Fe-S-cluster-containing dehydrogenase component